MSAAKVTKLMKDNGIKFVDLRFTDTRGKEQHVTLPSGEIDSTFFKEGKMFDGSLLLVLSFFTFLFFLTLLFLPP